MALGKTITWNGFDLYYWVIMEMASNKKNNTTKVILVPFKDEDARIENINHYIKDLSKTLMIEGHGLTVKQAYTKIKALSIPYNYIVSPEVPEELDPATGEVIHEMIPEVIEVRDHNFFRDAESLLT